MVNDRTGPDERDFQILAALRAATSAVPGPQLAARLGISRVALWKRIARLKGFAYRIEGGSRGYRLVEEDTVAPWEFQEGTPLLYRSETVSTMDEAWALAEGGAPSGTLIIADRQTAGRGRQDRPWLSSEGGLYLTLVLRPRLPTSHAACVALEGACALLEWLEAAHGCGLDFHWPNDLMAGSRKVGGLLVELAGTQERPRFYLLGLGVNLHGVDGGTSGLAELMEHPPLRRELATAFREHLTAWADAPRLDPGRWEKRCTQLARPVTLETWQGCSVQGVVQGFDARGGLVLAGPEHALARTFLPGEVLRIRMTDPTAGEPA
jgi:biotin-[acetyl-CoA-carboxylase] ligase BirA-like protein